MMSLTEKSKKTYTPLLSRNKTRKLLPFDDPK